jgi:carbamate kinase
VPLDWCGAQTQGTIGFLLLNALERHLTAGGLDRPVAALVTRTLVDPADAGFAAPSKPIGRYLPAAEARVMSEHGQLWQDRGERGWRRVVASPEPRAVLDAPAANALLAAGYIVVAAGGGGIPVARDATGSLHGVEAVIDKDLSAALLARAVGAQTLIIATDVAAAMLDFGTPRARPLGLVTAADLRRYADEGHFTAGSMGPKVEAACRFVEAGGDRAVITSLDLIADAVSEPAGTDGVVGTVVTRGREEARHARAH